MAPFLDTAEAIRLDPNLEIAYCNRVGAYLEMGDYDRVAADTTEVIRLGPKVAAPYCNSVSWRMATSPKVEVRNGKKAVDYATKACELTDWKEAAYLDTLAAAYAEAGVFEEAIKWQRKSIEAPDFCNDNREKAVRRLKLYVEGKPLRDNN